MPKEGRRLPGYLAQSMVRIMVTIGARENQHTKLHAHRLAVLTMGGSVWSATGHLIEEEMAGKLGSCPFVGVLSAGGRSDPRRPGTRRSPGSRAAYTAVRLAGSVAPPG